MAGQNDDVARSNAAMPICPVCKTNMRLFGIERQTVEYDLHSFDCTTCGRLEVVGVPAGPARDAPLV